MTSNSLCRILSIFIILTNTYSRDFERTIVEDGICGAGEEYPIFFDLKNKKKLVLEFQGGGVCWNKITCLPINNYYNPNKVTRITGLSTNIIEKVQDHSYFFLPYCTGDFFIGDYSTTYNGFTVHHQGYNNYLRTIDFLKNKVDLTKLEEIIIVGKSAGAIGLIALFNHLNIIFKNVPNKFLILDSPGLHFGEKVWKRIPRKLFEKLQYFGNFSNIEINYDDGNVANQFGNFCDQFSNWEIGILQTTKDWVMSSLMGAINMKKHKALVLGETGIFSSSSKKRNCHVWVQDSIEHVLLLKTGLNRHKVEGQVVKKYLEDLLEYKGGSYKDSFIVNEDGPL